MLRVCSASALIILTYLPWDWEFLWSIFTFFIIYVTSQNVTFLTDCWYYVNGFLLFVETHPIPVETPALVLKVEGRKEIKIKSLKTECSFCLFPPSRETRKTKQTSRMQSHDSRANTCVAAADVHPQSECTVCQVKYANAPGGCLVALFSKGLHIVHHIYSISRFFKRSIIKMLKKFQPYIQVPLNPVSKQDSTSSTAH